MRILYFSQGFSPHDERFLAALAGTGHEVIFLRLEPEEQVTLPENVNEVVLPGVKAAMLKHNYSSIVRRLDALLDTLHPDLVHAGPLQGPAWLAARTSFKPLVSMSWGSDLLKDADRSLKMRWRTRYTLAKTSVLLADCEAVAQKAVSYGFSRDRIRVFPWGVDLAHFNPEGNAPLRKKLNWQKNTVFLCNRTMEPLYGVDVVLNAFIEAAGQFPQARLILMGKGSQEESLRQKAVQAGMSDNVYFGGFASRADLPGIYRGADVYVSASHSDGSSVSLMEALACGKPALVSSIPGNREWIQTGVQGWLFKDGDASELAAKMKMICENGVEPMLSTNARLLAEARADWGRNFQSLMDAYELALGSV